MTDQIGIDVKVSIDWTTLGRDLAGGSALEQAGLLNALGARLRELGFDGELQAMFISERLDNGGRWLLEELGDPVTEEYDGE